MRLLDLRRNALRMAALGVCGLAMLLPSRTVSQEAAKDLSTPQPIDSPDTPATKPAKKPPATRPATARAIDPAIAAKVKSLLDELGNPDWKLRKRASDDLERLGELAEPALEEALRRRDLNVDARTAIEVLLKQAAERKRIGATLVTLKLDDADPLAAITALLEQGSLTLSADAKALLKSAGRKIDVDLDRQPLWSGLNQVCGKAGVGFTGLSEREVSLALTEGDQELAGPAAADGPFMLTVQRVEVTVRKVLDFAGIRGAVNPMANAFTSPPVRVSIAAWAEPHVKPGTWMLEGVSDIKTDKGKTLNAQVYGFSRNTKLNDGSTTYITLSGDTEGATSIAEMTVKARMVLQWSTETFEADNVQQANELTKTVAGNRVTLKQMKKIAGDNWSFEVTLHRDNRPPDEWAVLQQTIDRNGCRVVDEAGKVLQQRGSGSSWSSNEIRINGTVSQANGAGEPKKLTWELPGKIETLPGTFEYRNLPLP